MRCATSSIRGAARHEPTDTRRCSTCATSASSSAPAAARCARSKASTCSIDKGEIVGLVGESGSGKSVLSYALLGISDRAARVTGGSARVRRHRSAAAPAKTTLADLRGREISMIFQSPRTALNPIRRVGQQIEDVLRRHAAAPGADLGTSLKERAVQALRDVAISDPERRAGRLPVRDVGRHVPARDDRAGAGLPARAC